MTSTYIGYTPTLWIPWIQICGFHGCVHPIWYWKTWKCLLSPRWLLHVTHVNIRVYNFYNSSVFEFSDFFPASSNHPKPIKPIFTTPRKDEEPSKRHHDIIVCSIGIIFLWTHGKMETKFPVDMIDKGRQGKTAIKPLLMIYSIQQIHRFQKRSGKPMISTQETNQASQFLNISMVWRVARWLMMETWQQSWRPLTKIACRLSNLANSVRYHLQDQ